MWWPQPKVALLWPPLVTPGAAVFSEHWTSTIDSFGQKYNNLNAKDMAYFGPLFYSVFERATFIDEFLL